MTAILLHSNKIGSTGWICLRRGNNLKVRGIKEGDQLIAAFLPQGRELSIDEDGLFPFPTEAEHVQIEHRELANRENGGGVNIDLVRVKV